MKENTGLEIWAERRPCVAEAIGKFEQTAAIAQKTLVFMTKNNIPATPESYKVWFEYHCGGNEELERDVREKADRGMPLDEETTQKLYNQYYGDKERQRIIALVEEQAGKLLKEIIENVLIGIDDTTEYNRKLRQYSLALNSASDANEVKRIINDLVRDTNIVEESNGDLQKKLEDLAAETESLKKQIEQKERDLLKDPLTGLYNRRALRKKLQESYDEFIKDGAVFSCIMCDINSFKQFNDQYGHIIGDEALQIVSATLEENTKGRDVVARYGGDEFMLVLPMTPLYSASMLAENLRRAVANKRMKLIKTGQLIEQLSISLGVAQIHTGDTMEMVMERADAALLLKKTENDKVKSEKDLPHLKDGPS